MLLSKLIQAVAIQQAPHLVKIITPKLEEFITEPLTKFLTEQFKGMDLTAFDKDKYSIQQSPEKIDITNPVLRERVIDSLTLDEIKKKRDTTFIKPKKKRVISNRRGCNQTPYTWKEYHYIQKVFNDNALLLMNDVLTGKKLTAILNRDLNLKRSLSSYRSVWTNNYDTKRIVKDE